MPPSIAGLHLRPRHPVIHGRRPFPLNDFLQGMVDRIRGAAMGPFVGVTASGSVAPGLFSLTPTGVSTALMLQAARDLLESLSPEQRVGMSFELDSHEWRTWSNISPFLLRHGVLLEDLSDNQRDLALELVRQSLSSAGYQSARDVMRLNETIGEIAGRPHEYGEWAYWLSLFGTPSEDQPWGWQVDGHHLILNCVVLGDQVVIAPQFMGSEPVLAESGKYAGTRVFQPEEEHGLALMQSLSLGQQDQARIGMQLPHDVFGTAGADNLVLPYGGIAYADLEPTQRSQLWDLIDVYIGRIRPAHARVKLEEIRSHLDDTHFAWIGPSDDDAAFYYRVHSPVVLIEFDHQSGVVLDNDAPSRNHIHTVVRTPNGNDYGKDLLRQHYARHHQP